MRATLSGIPRRHSRSWDRRIRITSRRRQRPLASEKEGKLQKKAKKAAPDLEEDARGEDLEVEDVDVRVRRAPGAALPGQRAGHAPDLAPLLLNEF